MGQRNRTFGVASNGSATEVVDKSPCNGNDRNRRRKKRLMCGLWRFSLHVCLIVTVVVVLSLPRKRISPRYDSKVVQSKSTKGNMNRDSNSDGDSDGDSNSNSNSNSESNSESNSNSNSNSGGAESSGGNEERKKKKFYAIHIGPAKTGSTAITRDSGQNEDFKKALELDGVAYMGKNSDNGKKWGISQLQDVAMCMIKIYHSYWNTTDNNINDDSNNDNNNNQLVAGSTGSYNNNNNNNSRSLLREKFIKDCWGRRYEKYIHTSILDSSEDYSYLKYCSLVAQIDVLRTILVDYLDYDEVIAIGVYRPYAEWLSSIYREETGQSCLSNKKKIHRSLPCRNIWNYTKQLMTMNQHNHEYNGIIQRREYYSIASTLGGPHEHNPGIDVKILNQYFRYDINNNHHGYNSITTELYCDALGETRTPNTCTFSKDRTSAGTSTDSNSSSSSAAGTVFNSRSYDTVWFDDILLAGAQKGFLWIGGDAAKLNRRDARDRLKEYYEKELLLELEQDTTNGDDNNHFPFLCPNQEELETLLNKSLEFERLVKKKFSLPQLHDNEEEEAEYKRRFWKMVKEDKVFCWIDTHKLFSSTRSDIGNSSPDILDVTTNSNFTSFWETVFRKAFSPAALH